VNAMDPRNDFKGQIRSKVNVKGVRQECPTHTGNSIPAVRLY